MMGANHSLQPLLPFRRNIGSAVVKQGYLPPFRYDSAVT